MYLKTQLIGEGYTGLRKLNRAGKEVLYKRWENAKNVITEYKIFDNPYNPRTVTRRVNEHEKFTGWSVNKPNGEELTQTFRPNLTSVTRFHSNGVSDNTMIYFSENGNRIDRVIKNYNTLDKSFVNKIWTSVTDIIK